MWTKLKELFKGTPGAPKPTRLIGVGRAKVTIIENDGTEHVVNFTGEYLGECSFSGGDWIRYASGKVESWQERCGKLGTAGIGGGIYIPMCNIKRIEIAHDDHQVEVA